MDYDSILKVIRTLVPKDSGKEIGNADEPYQIAMTVACGIHSKYRPYEITSDEQTVTEKQYLPNNWIPNFSSVMYVESPTGQFPKLLVDMNYVHYDNDGIIVMLALGSKYKVRYTTLHTCSKNSDGNETVTIDIRDRVAFCYLAASVMFDAISAKVLESSDPSINADLTNRKSKSSEYRVMAENAFNKYCTIAGIDKMNVVPGAVVYGEFAGNENRIFGYNPSYII